MTKLYEDLGVDAKADKPTIKRAYRKKAQQHHPDKPNGDAKKFHAIQKAYEVLSDDERRQKYDQTGDTADAPEMDEKAFSVIASLLLQVIERENIMYCDVIEKVKGIIKDSLNTFKQTIVTVQNKKEKFQSAAKRLKSKGNAMNVLNQVIDSKIVDCDSQIKAAEKAIEEAQCMLTILKDYEYQTETLNKQTHGNGTSCFIASAFGPPIDILKAQGF